MLNIYKVYIWNSYYNFQDIIIDNKSIFRQSFKDSPSGSLRNNPRTCDSAYSTFKSAKEQTKNMDNSRESSEPDYDDIYDQPWN